MKKYLLGLFAVALAIGFSAFTSTDSVSTKTDPGFYYKVDFTDNFKVLEIYGSTTREGAQSQVSCDNTGSLDCVRGYEEDPELEIGQVSPSPDFFIKKTN